MAGNWHAVEVYSNFLRIRGYLEVFPGQRLTDEVNRMQDYLELRNTVTEPLLASYPVVGTQETNTTIAKASIVMVVPTAAEDQAASDTTPNPMLRKPKIRHHVIINTTAFSMAAETHLDPNQTLLSQLQRNRAEFLPVTRVGAVMVTSLGATPHTMQHPFALVNPAAIVSFSVREGEEEKAKG